MTLVEKFGPYLPYLRRFSRALTGSQQNGDQYVRIALEALLSGSASVEEDLPGKLALYRMFLGIWNTSGAQLETQLSGAPGTTPSDHIKKLTPVSRQAFLLNAMEGMTIEEISLVMNCSEDEAKDYIQQAEKDLESELRTNVLIIEDEPIIAADIESIVNDLGHTVDSVAATRTEAVKMAKDKTPGLVLADVQLADGSSGIDAVDDILGDIDVPVIFITAFPERLLTGEKPEPAYLISKPFDPDNVKAAVSQALFFKK